LSADILLMIHVLGIKGKCVSSDIWRFETAFCI